MEILSFFSTLLFLALLLILDTFLISSFLSATFAIL